jgi:fermentation-respiration switch protein FrsA (DUF1100 family)
MKRYPQILPAVTLLVLLLGGCVTMRVSDNTWFHPGPVPADSIARALPLANGATLQEMRFRASDSTWLHAVLVRTPRARATVLYFGGDNFRIAANGPALARAASMMGVNAMLVDYRGYGSSEGTPTLPAVKQDGLDAFDHLRRLPGMDAMPIVVHGFSMGSFIAAHVATERPAAALVLESTATTVRDWARGFVPGYAKPFVRVRMSDQLAAESNLARVQRYRGPLLLIVGENDRVTRPAMSRELYSRSATPTAQRELIVVPAAGHGDALNDQTAATRYAAFIAKVARGQ